jgi:hypothetical protein
MKNIIRTLLAAGVGLTLGWVCGQAGHRRNTEAMIAGPQQPLPPAGSTNQAQDRQLKKIRSVVNDIHKHILAVSKGLQKPAL